MIAWYNIATLNTLTWVPPSGTTVARSAIPEVEHK